MSFNPSFFPLPGVPFVLVSQTIQYHLPQIESPFTMLTFEDDKKICFHWSTSCFFPCSHILEGKTDLGTGEDLPYSSILLVDSLAS